MRTKEKMLAGLLVLSLLIAALGGCAQQVQNNSEPLSSTKSSVKQESAASVSQIESAASDLISVTDMKGRAVTLEEPADKIVALNPADCEILFALGAGDLLVGRGSYCNFPEQALDIPSVESGKELSVEQIIALQPQVVLMNSMAHTEEQAKALEDVGIKVVVSEATNIEGVYESIALLGAVVAKDQEANKLIDQMKSEFAKLKDKSATSGNETVYFELSPLEYGLWTAGKGTFMHELATLLGLKNAFEDVEGWAEISEEQIIERNPDYIVTIAMYMGEGPDPVEEILGRKGWESIKAIERKHVFNADNDQIARPGPRLVDAAKSLYEFVYVASANSQSSKES